MKKFSKFVGMDVHKATIAVSVADANGGEVRYVEDRSNTYQCPVPLIRAQSLCSFARMESAEAVHENGLQFSL